MKTMTSRERLLAAIQHQKVDCVPCSPRIWAVLLERFKASDWRTDLKAAAYFDYDPHIIIPSGMPKPFSESGDSTKGLRDVRIEVAVKDDDDTEIIERTIHTPAGPLHETIKKPKPGRAEYGISPNPHRVEPMLKDDGDLAKMEYLMPDPAACDPVPGYAEMEKEIGDRGLLQVCVESPLDYRLGEAYPSVQMMVDCYEKRDFVEKALRLFQKQVLAETKAVLEKGVTGIFAPWFYSSLSAGWSPAIYGDFFAPLLKEHVELVHSYGALYDMYDDGKLMGILDIVKDCGVDVLETLTPPPVGDADLAEIKRRIGDAVCLKGYVDLLYVVKQGTPELIEKTVHDAITVAAPGGGFILGSSDSFRDGTPLENLKAYFGAARKYGRRAGR